MKITILSKLTFAFIFSSIFLSCEKEEIALPAKPVTAGEQSAPSGPETPGNPKPSTSDSVLYRNLRSFLKLLLRPDGCMGSVY